MANENDAANEAALKLWWREDAERHNRLGEIAAGLGYVQGTPVTPSKLNDDGSLAEEEG